VASHFPPSPSLEAYEFIIPEIRNSPALAPGREAGVKQKSDHPHDINFFEVFTLTIASIQLALWQPRNRAVTYPVLPPAEKLARLI
jgi:hypothetical protein